MSPRSPNRRRRQAKGAQAPEATLPPSFIDAFNSLAKRVSDVEASQFLRAKHTDQTLLRTMDLESPPATNARTTTPPAPPNIKPRLEEIISRLGMLCEKLDHIDCVVAGVGVDVNRGGGGASPSPHSIPEMLSMVEELLSRATLRASELGDRF